MVVRIIISEKSLSNGKKSRRAFQVQTSLGNKNKREQKIWWCGLLFSSIQTVFFDKVNTAQKGLFFRTGNKCMFWQIRMRRYRRGARKAKKWKLFVTFKSVQNRFSNIRQKCFSRCQKKRLKIIVSLYVVYELCSSKWASMSLIITTAFYAFHVLDE